MKKDNLLKIARSIFLQDSVSRQLYAAMYNLGDPINEDLGSFVGRTPDTLYKLFGVFVGSQPESNSQFIEKNGDSFKVYPYSSDGQVDFNSNPKQINGIESLYSYLHANNATISYSPNAILPLLQKLRTTLGYYGNTAQKYKSLINFDAIVSEYQSVENSYHQLLTVLVNQLANKWIQDITIQIQNILKKQDLGIIPLIFESSKASSPAAILNTLQTQIVSTIMKQLDSDKIICNSKNQNFNTIWNNANANIKRISQYVLQLSDVKNLFISPVLNDQQGDSQQGSLTKTGKTIGTVTQYIGAIMKFIYDVENSQQLGQEEKSLILRVIKESNNNGELKKKWGLATKKMSEVTPRLADPLTNTQNGSKSFKTTILHFLTGNDGNLRPSSWEAIKSNLNYIFRNNEQYKKYIDNFDKVIQFLTDSNYRGNIGVKAMEQRIKTDNLIADLKGVVEEKKNARNYDSYKDIIEQFLGKITNRTATVQDVQDMTKIGFGYFARAIKDQKQRIIGIVSSFGWQKQFDQLAKKYQLDQNIANGLKDYINVNNKIDISRHQLDGVQFVISDLLKCFLIDD